MVSNQTGLAVGYLAGRFPGALGHLYSPGGQRGPWEFLPYALDNGAFSAFNKREEWDVGAWRRLLTWARHLKQRPLWVLVPDKVGDAKETIRMWGIYSEEAASLGAPLAFAVQDGMMADDVQPGADLIFVGGSTEWKRRSVARWCSSFPRVHVGRVNGYRWLVACERAGVESVDGTGWFRDNDRQAAGLAAFLRGDRPPENHALPGVFDEARMADHA